MDNEFKNHFYGKDSGNFLIDLTQECEHLEHFKEYITRKCSKEESEDVIRALYHYKDNIERLKYILSRRNAEDGTE